MIGAAQCDRLAAGTPRRASNRVLGRLVVAVVGALFGLASLATPAGAHAALIETSPADGQEVDEGPDRVVLTFSEPMQRPAAIEVSDPEGDQVADGEPEIDGERVTVGLEALDADGTYTVQWRAVSADDHPLEGEFSFEVAQTETGSTSGDESPREDGPAPDEEAPAPDDPEDEAAQGAGAQGEEQESADDTADLAAAVRQRSDPTADVVGWLLAGAGLAAVAASGAALWAQRRDRGQRADPV